MPETYICTEPFEVTTHGATHMIEEIIVKAPTGRMQGLFSKLESEYNKLQKILAAEASAMLKDIDKETADAALKILESQEKENKDDSAEAPIEERVKEFLVQVKSAGFDTTSSYSILKEILCYKNSKAEIVSSIGSHMDIQTGHWDDFPMKEIRNLLGFYILNFIDSSD